MDKKFSELPLATSLAAADIFPIVQSSANKKITAEDIFGKINVPVVINEAQGDQDTKISGLADADLVFVDASTDRVGIGTNAPTEKLDVDGGLKLNGISRNSSIVTQSSSGAIDITADTTILNIATASTATLADGEQGQTKTIVASAAGPIVVTPSTLSGGTTITLDAIGDSVTLKFLVDRWYIVGSNGVTVA